MYCKNKNQRGIAQLVVVALMAFLALGIPLSTKLVQQNQENRSKATNELAEEISCCGKDHEKQFSSSEPKKLCLSGSKVDSSLSYEPYNEASLLKFPEDPVIGMWSWGCAEVYGVCYSDSCYADKLKTNTDPNADPDPGTPLPNRNPSNKIDGKCSSAITYRPDSSSCVSGKFQDVADKPGEYIWNCLGISGGKDVRCTKRLYTLKLDKTSVTLKVGKYTNIQQTLTPNSTTEVFTWTSSDNAVARVYIPACSDDRSSTCDGAYYTDNGKKCTKCQGINMGRIIAKKKGKATITIKASPSGLEKTVTVTVE